MITVIHKFTLRHFITSFRIVKPLALELKNYTPVIWVECDANGPSVNYRISCIGTGQPFEKREGMEYLGTLQENSGFVWHYYLEEV